MNLADRKNAFLNVLASNLDINIRNEIMNHWEEKYASRPQFGVSAFLDEIYSQYKINIKKGQLFRELSRATMAANQNSNVRTSSGVTLEPDQSEIIDQNGLIVFQALQDEFANLARPADRMKITKAQFDGIQQQKNLSPTSVKEILNWLRQGNRAMPSRIELGLLKKLFNLAYVEGCQLYGPVKADQMLNTALQKANSIAEAHIVPPVYFI